MDLRFCSIGKTYRSKITALKDVNLTASDGCTCVIGPRGAGVSTLLNIGATLIQPTAGHFEVTGVPVSAALHEDYRARVALVPQSVRFPRSMTVRDVLVYQAWLLELDTSESGAIIDRLLTRFGLRSLAETRTRSLSVGQVRRLAIAAALVGNPKILFIDSPSLGMDEEHRVRVRQLINKLARERVILVGTDLLDDARGLTGRLAVLGEGHLLYTGSFPEIEPLLGERGREPGTSFDQVYPFFVAALSTPLSHP